MLPLSVFIITYNEADRLPLVLEALGDLAGDVVVVDSGSDDGTQDVARRHGARLIEHPFPGYGPQKRFAERECRHPWLLNLDADEVLSPALRAEIAGLFAHGQPEADAYEIAIHEVFPGEDEPHPLGYALTPVRLYRRDKGSYNPSPVHDRVDLVAGAKVARLKGRIRHISVRSLGHQLEKLNSYTDAQVLDLEARGIKVTTLRVFLEFPGAFLKAYFGRRHFLRGIYGFMTAMNFAFYRYLRVAKTLERRRLRDKGIEPQ
ncbi:MAG: glycosyltransferase family 2 protein [Hyphomicrobiales bacterium]|nr:glycosyltransferase family 2 protein [Hyphomicrobiales bacterium]MBV8426936.1 glycosyltransferase family 2 protein [Hyphomicrobiales bacterium]